MAAVREAALLLLITVATLGCAAPPQGAKNLTFENVFESPPAFPEGFFPPEDWDEKLPFFDFDPRDPRRPRPFTDRDAYAIILNQTEWDYLFTPYKPPPSPIDFKDKFAIAYGRTYPIGGRVKILNLTQSDGTITITVNNRYLWPAQVPTALTPWPPRIFPYDVVTVKKSELLQKGDITSIFKHMNGTQIGNVTRFIS